MINHPVVKIKVLYLYKNIIEMVWYFEWMFVELFSIFTLFESNIGSIIVANISIIEKNTNIQRL